MIVLYEGLDVGEHGDALVVGSNAAVAIGLDDLGARL